MLRKVDKHSGIPSYLQIVNMVKKEIILGNLNQGDKLPPVRELQDIFDVNVNTVLKALERLKVEGFVEAEHGVGHFISKNITINKSVVDDIKIWVNSLKKYNIDFHTAILIFEEVWKNDN